MMIQSRLTNPKYQIDRTRSKKKTTTTLDSLQRLDGLVVRSDQEQDTTTAQHRGAAVDTDALLKQEDARSHDNDGKESHSNPRKPKAQPKKSLSSRGPQRGRPTRKAPQPPPQSDDEAGESSEAEFQDKDDASDEDFVPIKRKGIATSTSSSSEEDLDHVVDSDEEADSKARKRRPPGKITVARKPRQRSTVRNDLDDFIADEDEHLEEYPPVKSGKALRSTKPKQTRGKRLDNGGSSDEGPSDEEDESVTPAYSKRSVSRRTVHSTRKAPLDDSGSEDFVVKPSTAKRSRASATLKKESKPRNKQDLSIKSRPRRSSASRAVHKLRTLNDSFDEEDDEEDVLPKPGKSRASQILSSDEEFLGDSASEQSAEQEIGNTDSENESGDIVTATVRGKPAVNVDNDDIGSADESSDDEVQIQDPRQSLSGKGYHLDEIQPSPAKPPHLRHYDSSDDDDDAGKSPPFHVLCPSTEDAITLESLPQIHVCYVSPDGNARQCFAIETLRQITLKSSQRASRIAIDGSQQDTFLQPPHFRTPMSADLLDQIASRFGRDALNLHGDFFNRRNIARSGPLDSDNYLAFFGESRLDYGEQFEERVTKYINGMMGSRDVYCCCLCYSEMHRRIVSHDVKGHAGRSAESGSQSSDDEQFLKLAPDSEYDPMTVLGWLDNDKYAAASCFCFGKVATLKRHLRDDHMVQTNGITGNDLYQRYRVRGTDGLLQRYLHNQRNRSHHSTFQGSMQRYWFDGANQSFVCLLEMVDRADTCRDVLDNRNATDDLREQAEAYFEIARDFFESFQNRAQTEWEQISSPFQKHAQKDDLRDFLADEDTEDDVEDQYPHFLAHRHLERDEDSDPNDLVHKLERKYADGNPQDSSEDEEDEISVSSVLNRKGYYSEEEEQKDEWVASIQKKKRKKSLDLDKPSSSTKRQKETPRGKTLTRKKHPTPSSASTAQSGATSALAPMRRAIEDSSSEDEFH